MSLTFELEMFVILCLTVSMNQYDVYLPEPLIVVNKNNLLDGGNFTAVGCELLEDVGHVMLALLGFKRA